MTHKPMMKISEKHIHGLGFRMKQLTKKDCNILLNLKEEDLRVKLILAHYSMNLMPAFLIEGCLSIVLKKQSMTDENFDAKKIKMGPLFDVVVFYENLFRNEHFSDYQISKESVLRRVDHFVSKGLLKVKDNYVSVVEENKA